MRTQLKKIIIFYVCFYVLSIIIYTIIIIMCNTSFLIPGSITKCRFQPPAGTEVLSFSPATELRGPVLCGAAAFATGSGTYTATATSAPTATDFIYYDCSMGSLLICMVFHTILHLNKLNIKCCILNLTRVKQNLGII